MLNHVTDGHMGPFEISCLCPTLRFMDIFLKCVVFIRTRAFIQRGQSCGMGIWALIKSAHVPVQHPGHISNACSALLCCWNMKYAWAIKSIWTIRLNTRHRKPSKRSLNLTHTGVHAHTYVHTKWHTNMHSHVVHNGLSVSTPTFCWQRTRNNSQKHVHTAEQILFRRGKRFDTDSCTFFTRSSSCWCKDITKSSNITTGEKSPHTEKHKQMSRLSQRHKQTHIHMHVPPH